MLSSGEQASAVTLRPAKAHQTHRDGARSRSAVLSRHAVPLEQGSKGVDGGFVEVAQGLLASRPVLSETTVDALLRYP